VLSGLQRRSTKEVVMTMPGIASPAPGRPVPSPADLGRVAVIQLARLLPPPPALTQEERGFLTAVKESSNDARLTTLITAMLAA
jgi:hypothetical protein